MAGSISGTAAMFTVKLSAVAPLPHEYVAVPGVKPNPLSVV